MPSKHKTKSAAKSPRLSATRFLEISLQLATPELLSADREYRRSIIHHLLDRHLREVLQAVASIHKPTQKESAHA